MALQIKGNTVVDLSSDNSILYLGSLNTITYNGSKLSIRGMDINPGIGTASSPPTGTVGIGRDSLSSLASNSYYNTAIGNQSLQNCTSGQYNTAVGALTSKQLTTANFTTAVGYGSLSNAVGSNTALGGYSGYYTTTGTSNTFIGDSAGFSLTTGNDNTFVGESSGNWTTVGSGNTVVGKGAQAAHYGGNGAADYNTVIGLNASARTGTNNTVIGYGSSASVEGVTNQITLGNSSITSLRCAVTSITSLSDARDKTNVLPLEYGLDFVKYLKPVSFTWNSRDKTKVGIKSSGFTAQDLQQAESVFNAADTLNLVYESNPDKLEATYGNLIPVLVKAIQELSAKVEYLEQALDSN